MEERSDCVQRLVGAAVERENTIDEQRMRGVLLERMFGEAAESLRMGRYRVVSRLGAGGLGVVYRAHDPELQRDVALKVMRQRSEESGGETLERMLVEARALAKLAHPNVVSVFEVGVHDDAVYMAMELVDGADLARWLAERPRSQAEIRRVFAAAGRGLAAAHAVGIVHRDFKPGNVLLGRNGRVRVADFGLASGGGPSHFVGGTAAYMAPEQESWADVDHRADIYSFCASLYEALRGRCPFSGPPDAVARAKRRGPPSTDGPPLPRDLARIIERGLAENPADRPATMTELVAILERDPGVRRRRWALVAGGAMVGAASVLLVSPDDPEARCRQSAAAIDATWTPQVRTSLRDRLQTAASAELGTSTVELLDAWVATWTQSRRAACVATHVQGTRSDAALDRTMACLDGRHRELSAVLEVLGRDDPQIAMRALDVVAGLTAVQPCIGAEQHTPLDPAEREVRDRLEAEIASVRLLTRAAALDEATELGRNTLQRAEALGDPSVIARAEIALSMAQLRAGDPPGAMAGLRRALVAAERGDAAREKVRARTGLIVLEGTEMGRIVHGALHVELAAAALERVSDGEDVAADLDGARASLLQAQGRLDEAEVAMRRAVDALVELYGERHPAAVRARAELAGIVAKAGRTTEGEATLREALAVAESLLGAEHPEVAQMLGNLAVLQRANGDVEGARRGYERALRITRDRYGPESGELAYLQNNLANLLRAQGELDEASQLYERAIRGHRAQRGERSPALATALTGLGQLRLAQGDPGAAVAVLEQALAIREAVPPRAAEMATVRFALARALVSTDRARALAEAERARAGVHGSLEHPELAKAIDEWLAEHPRERDPFGVTPD